MSKKPPSPTTGLRQFLDPEQQRSWIDGETSPADADERTESLELRFKYAPRFQKLLAHPQAQMVLGMLRLYGRNCIPMPRKTERHYWSVSCLPSTSDKPLIRVNASWMELFTIYADGEDIRARFIVHLSDFCAGNSPAQDQVDNEMLEHCVVTPGDVSSFFPRGEDIFGLNVRGSASIQKFLAVPHVLRAIRRFNVTHMNRGRNAYQASHCYSVADYLLEG